VNRSTAGGKWDPWLAIPAKIQRIIRETPDTKTYELVIDSNQYCWQPGQFNMLYLPGVGESAISISGGNAEQGLLRHSIRCVGAVTGALDAADVGTSIGLRGPFGTAWPIPQIESCSPPPDLIVVAGGIGLAPLRALITHFIANRQKVGSLNVLVGARTPADLLYADQYETWRDHDINVQTTVDRAAADWSGHIGVVTLLIERLVIARADATLVLTCGPEVMMRYVAQTAQRKGIPAKNIWVAMERNMNCAIGLCGHCQLGSEFICKDGPVFAYPRIAPLLHVQGL
jgi:NAD(P)H-flavin reductase